MITPAKTNYVENTVITNNYISSYNLEDISFPTSIINIYEQNDSFTIKHTAINERLCESTDNQTINHQVKWLYTKLLRAFIKSKLDTIEMQNTNTYSLVIIDSPSNKCFFKIASKYLQKIIVNSKFTHQQKLDILYRLCLLLKTPALSAEQYKIAINFVFSAINCLILTKTINNVAIWEEKKLSFNSLNTCIYNPQSASELTNNKIVATQLKQYPVSIDLLCIEEEKRFIYKKNNKVVDLGSHALDNEWLYMERCHRAFVYLLNTQISEFHEINFSDLRNTNAIQGGNISMVESYGYVYYGCDIPYAAGDRFLQLLKQGVLSDENLVYDNVNISIEERLTKLQQLLEKIFQINIPLTTININGKYYFTVKLEQLPNNINSTDANQQLLDDLHGKTDNKAFAFQINMFGDDKSEYAINLRIQYIYNKKRADVCQQLLNIYYDKLQAFPEDTKKKVNLAVGLCIMLQRIHPFVDANGRTIFFTLLPILLYQFNIWLTRMCRDIWLLLDIAAPEEIAERILALCIPAPVFKNKISFYDNIKLEELIRISASLGDLKMLKSILLIKPSILCNTIEITPAKKHLSLLEIAILHNQPNLVDFILTNTPEHILSLNFLKPLIGVGVTYGSKSATEVLLQYIEAKFDMVMSHS